MPKPELRRREGEEAYEDPREQSLVKRLSKIEIPGGPAVDVLIRVIVMIFVGGGAGFVANEHATAADTLQAERLARVRQDFDEFRQAYVQVAALDAGDERKHREEVIQRLTAIETELRLLRRAR